MPRLKSLSPLFALLLMLLGCTAPEPEGDAATDAAPGTDIWLFELQEEGGASLITRITDSNGYDNQPMFSPDGRTLLFSSNRAGYVQTFAYDVATGATTQVTDTPSDKYSPTFIPGSDGAAFSVVITDTLASPSVMQGLWRFSLNDSGEPAPVAEVDWVAYFTWAGPDNVLFWRLGETPSLQLLNVADSSTEIIEEGMVLSLNPIPGQQASSYILSVDDVPAVIKRFDWATKATSDLAPGLPGSLYFNWTPDGMLLMIADGVLHGFTPGVDSDWRVLAEFGLSGDSRIAVSPDGRLMAVTGSH